MALARKYNCDKMICRKCYVCSSSPPLIFPSFAVQVYSRFSLGWWRKADRWDTLGTSSAASDQLPEEEMWAYESVEAEEEA